MSNAPVNRSFVVLVCSRKDVKQTISRSSTKKSQDVRHKRHLQRRKNSTPKIDRWKGMKYSKKYLYFR